MSQAEYPADTDVEYIKKELNRLHNTVETFRERFDKQAEGLNSIGANMQWLVQNVQGIFQMFASPTFMNQMTQMMMGQVNNAGQSEPAESAESASGTNS